MARPPAPPGAPTPTPTPRPVEPENYVSDADYLETCIENLETSGSTEDTLTYGAAIEWAKDILKDMRDAEL